MSPPGPPLPDILKRPPDGSTAVREGPSIKVLLFAPCPCPSPVSSIFSVA
jgi:hypothetical protein